MDFKDYYQVLGIDRNASAEDIRKAYRSMARQYHPDINKDPGAEERFKAINEANQVLSDPDKRARYDSFGADWSRVQASPGNADIGDFSEWFSDFRQQSGDAGASNVRFEFSGGEAIGFSDFFDLLFGSRGQSPADHRTTRRPARRGEDQEMPVGLTLEEAFNGTTRQFELATREPCQACGGTGRNGRGPCRVCGGLGNTAARNTIEVTIPRGVREGSRVRVAGKGHPSPDGGAPGDVFLKIKLRQHELYELQNDTLRANLKVPLYTALLGGEEVIKLLSGQRIAVTIPPETQNGRTIRLRGQGWPVKPSSDKRGDLLVRVEVELPTNLDQDERKLIEELRDRREAVKSAPAA